MWSQKKSHSQNSNTENSFGFKKVLPKFRGTEDIDILLEKSKSNDELEKQAKKKSDSNRGCGCGF